MKIRIEVKTVWKTGLAIKILHQDKSIARGKCNGSGTMTVFRASTGLMFLSDNTPELMMSKGVFAMGGKTVEHDVKTIFEDYKTAEAKNTVLTDILNGLCEFAENGYVMKEIHGSLILITPKNKKVSKKFKGIIKDGVYSF